MLREFRIVLLLTAAALPVFAEEPESPTLTLLPKSIPSPESNPTTPAKVELGKHLFFDPRLSGDNKMSCATCHIPEKAFADGLAKSPGAGGKLLNRNTQGLANIGLLVRPRRGC